MTEVLDLDQYTATPWFGNELPTATPWLVAQLAYDRIRKQLKEDGYSPLAIEAQLEWACRQLVDRSLSQLASDAQFALFLEQAFQGNIVPNY